MMFHEIRFPTDIARGATGGPERRTEIISLGSGHEERNTRWAHSRRQYNAGYGIKTLNDLQSVVEFFEERRGRLYGFRWRDPMDYKSSAPEATAGTSDQTIGTGDGATAIFQLIKQYGSLHAPYSRTITKPVTGTVLIAVNGALKTETTDYSINYTTGIVTFEAAHIPGSGEPVTAGYEFDVPVRFDTDHLKINLSRFKAGEIPSIPIIEIRI